MLVDVLLEHFGQPFGEGPSPEILEVHVAINGVALEILVLLGQSDGNFDFVVDVLLRPVLDSHVPQLQRYFSIQYHARSVSTSVHDIDLSDDSEGPSSFGVPLPPEVQTLRSSHVSVGRNDCQDDGPVLLAIPLGHFCGDFLDIVDLVPH